MSEPDGALWFTDDQNNTMGRITTAGVVTTYSAPTIDDPEGIVLGPDGNLWFINYDGGSGGSIGSITPAGVVSNFSAPSVDGPAGITVGPDGALWFTNSGNNSIGRITTAGVISSFSGSGIDGPEFIAAGSDGALWFSNGSGGALGDGSIGRITTSGVISTFSGPSIGAIGDVTEGPDGALWYTSGDGQSIGQITTTGVVSNYPDSSVNDDSAITVGPDGDLWFTAGSTIDDITTSGVLGTATDLGLGFLGFLTEGPDSALWFVTRNAGSNSIGRFGPPVAPTISGTPPAVAEVTSPYQFEFTLTGASVPTTSVTAGALPPGLTLSSDGFITGVPTTPGSYSATVTATNGVDPDATEDIAIRILPPSVAISPHSGPPGSAVSVSGSGFKPGEPVRIRYVAGNQRLAVCSSHKADAEGNITCAGIIPGADAGSLGGHRVTAKGSSSHVEARTRFHLT